MKRKFRDESGSVTIEAAISLSVFMFASITILTIVNICIVQTKIGIAINSTAKELSHYSYLYSLTGLNDSHKELADGAQKTEEEINGLISDVNDVFTEIQNVGKTMTDPNASRDTPEDITNMLNELKDGYNNVSEAGGKLKETLATLAEDPKHLAMGLAKIAANDGWNLVMSRLIAAPLSEVLCKKNLVPQKNGNVESYLSSLGVVPGADNRYLDFSKSTIFPNGSNEIRVTVSYDAKLVALLPIDFTFHFCQSAVTNGWLAGKDSYRTTEEVLKSETNHSIWTDSTVKERASLIRHQGIKDFISAGYAQVTGGSYSDIHVYSKDHNEFVAFHSMNPLYSPEGEPTLTLNDISDTAIKEQIEHLCTGISDTTKGLKEIQTKSTSSDGSVKKTKHNCENNTGRIVLTIPEDAGLKEKIQSIINTCNTRGITVELNASYGNGARTTIIQNGGGAE